MRTHSLEGRKREERVGELGNVTRHKRELTYWRGGRGRSGLEGSEMGHVANEDSLPGGEEKGGAGCGARKWGSENTVTIYWEGRRREGGVGELGNVGRHKGGLSGWRGGRGRSGLVSLEMWHVTNEHSLAGGEEEGGAGW